MSVRYCDNIYSRFKNMVYAAAWRYTSDPDVWEDLVQEGFIGLHDACQGYDSRRGTFESYVWCRIRNRITRYLQYKHDAIHVPVESPASVEMIPIDDVELTVETDPAISLDITSALAILEPRIAELVVQVYIRGLTIKEVAELFDIEYETCRSRVNSALLKMKEWMS